jgi:2-dehydro-3-deoxyphosphooctonate aldolase (KDO 8-P synthase)
MILIAGPCVIESKEAILKIAEELKPLNDNSNIDFYFKASFDKANRTSLNSFRGIGIDEGLEILQEVKERFGYKIVTDVHETIQVEKVAKVVDVLQIPAFLCRQTDLLVACAKTDCIINIKKGQFLDPRSMKYPLLKVLNTRGINDENYENSKKSKVWLCERGNTFGYGNLVVDMRSLPIMKSFAPVIFDATHSVQMPSTDGKTGGDSSFVPYLAKGAAAVGVDGFFFETHTNPKEALSDAANMLEIEELKLLVKDILKIREVLN